MIMVADGVGSWTKRGTDPGLFTKNMCGRAGQLYAEDYHNRDLKSILVEAVRRSPEKGSCTAVIASLESDTLSTLNLGDSGYVLYSHDPEFKQVFRSKEQQHRFNCPYQCGNHNKSAARAKPNTHTVRHNDVIVMGTDGLFDNVEDEVIFEKCIEPRVLETGDLDDL